MKKRSIWEVILTPITVAVIGIIGTITISQAQLESANAIAQSQQKIKIIEIFSDKITHNDHRERELAIKILTTLDSELGQEIVIAVKGTELDVPIEIDGMESSVANDVGAKISVQSNPNSKYLIGIYGLGISKSDLNTVSDSIGSAGYTIITERILAVRPSWLSNSPTVFYYSDDTKDKANELKEQLVALTGKKFRIAKGEGLGVPKGQENLRFFIHYNS